jgi:hypothetical protein
VGSNKGAAKLLGVDKKNIRKGVDRHLALDTSRNAF